DSTNVVAKRAYVKDVLGRDLRPQDMTPIEWGKLYSALVSDDLDEAQVSAGGEPHGPLSANTEEDVELDWNTGRPIRGNE
ncbi:MAG: hypothetical protein NUW01_08950, partial [Gemmatimonadaceae bacterium]|nr:hypothetical protein [Gemmatimonadaceae bacterium]